MDFDSIDSVNFSLVFAPLVSQLMDGTWATSYMNYKVLGSKCSLFEAVVFRLTSGIQSDSLLRRREDHCQRGADWRNAMQRTRKRLLAGGSCFHVRSAADKV